MRGDITTAFFSWENHGIIGGQFGGQLPWFAELESRWIVSI